MTVKASLVLDSSIGDELSEEEAGVLAALMDYRELGEGELLIEEGTSDDSLHVLLSGKLEVVKKTGADETASLAVLLAVVLVLQRTSNEGTLLLALGGWAPGLGIALRADAFAAALALMVALIVSPRKMPSLILPPFVRRKIFGSGQGGV